MLGGALLMLGVGLAAMGYQWAMQRRGRVLTRAHRRWTYALLLYLWLVVLAPLVGLPPLGMLALELVLMVPLGFLLPHIWPRVSSAEEVVLVGYLWALMLELAQLPMQRMVGLAEIGAASLGTLVGYVFWRHRGYYWFCGRVSERACSLSRFEPVVYLCLVGGGGFLFYHWCWLFLPLIDGREVFL